MLSQQQVRLSFLGAIDVRGGADADVSHATQPKRAALLAYLAIATPRGPHRRDTLMALFWPELDDARARRALNQSIHQLRARLGEGVLESGGRDTIAFIPAAARCDVLEFEDLLDRGDLEAAVSLYRGDFLEGFHLSGVVDLERWIDDERARLRRRAADAMWLVAERASETGGERAVWWARRAFALAPPHDEPSLRRLVSIMDRAGDRAGAIREYERFAAMLAEDLEVSPSPETVALLEQLRARSTPHRPSGAVDSAVLMPVEVSVPVASRRALGRLTLTVAIVVAAGIAAVQFRSTSTPAAPMASGVAVFPFTYAGATNTAHLADAIPGLMTANLSGFDALYGVDARAVAEASRGSELTSQRSSRIAQELGAGSFVLGNVSEVAGRLRVSATLRDVAHAESPVVATVEGDVASLFTLVDELTSALLARRLAASDSARIGSALLTTSSPVALRAFTAGNTAYGAGRFAVATQRFREAVDADSTFALAWWQLSAAAHWTGEAALATSAAERAIRFSARLPHRAQSRVRAWDLYVRGAAAEAEQVLLRIVAEDVSDADAWVQLGEIGFHYGGYVGRPATESRTEWERALRLSPYNMVALLHLARIAAREGRASEFDALATRIAAREPGIEVATELRALRAFAFGTRPQREAAAARVAQLAAGQRDDVIRHALWVSQHPGDALDLLLPLFHDASFENREAGEMALGAGVALSLGMVQRALATLDSARGIEPARIVEYEAVVAALPLLGGTDALARARLRLEGGPSGRGTAHRLTAVLRPYAEGLAALRAGDSVALTRSEVALDRLRDSTAWGAELAGHARRYRALLTAERLRGAGRHADALAALGAPAIAPDGVGGVWRFARAHERYLRGDLLARLGRTQEASRWFATFPDPSAYDFMFLLPAELQQYALLRAQGRTVAAEEQRARIGLRLGRSDPRFRHPADDLVALLR